MKMMECINNFVDTMIDEKSQFETMQNEVARREDDVAHILNELEQEENNLINRLRSKIAENKDESIQAIFSQTSNSIFDTIQDANKKIKEAIAGMEFITKFEKQFTVSVFGKVKAGKSYIGNFVTGQPLRKNKIPSSYDKLNDLTVYVYDRGSQYKQNKLSTFDEEKECNGEEFYVNKSEATSTIQWVNIGGMCWFDTPGIGSITFENEELAKEYVKNSDLVIFACNSDAAGTRQEFYEIKQLTEMEKPILLLLTQSDTNEYDVDDEGNELQILVPKTEKDRKDQEQYMLDTLWEQGLESCLKYADILTVSALLATEAIKNEDEEMFEQSNMGKLLDKLTDITKNDAAEMKKKTPRNRINEMVDGIVSDLETIREQIRNTCAGIEDSKRELMERKEWILERIKASVNVKVLEVIAKAKSEVEHSSSTISGDRLADEITQIVKDVTQKVCMEETIISTERIPDIDVPLSGINDMKMRQDKIEYEHVRIRQVSRPPQGILEHLGSWLLDKEYYTSESHTEMKFSVFDIGVNDNEIAQNIMLQLNSVFASNVDGYINGLTEGYYEPVEILERETTDAIDGAVNKLQEMRM